MAESEYWSRFWKQRLSRRRLLRGAALSSGALATAALFGCASEEAGTPGGGNTPSVGGFRESDPGSIPHDGRRQAIPAPQGMTGGTLRFTGFDALVLDTFDPHQTQFGPLYSGHSAVFSKLYKYDSHSEQVRSTDLAEDMPEIVEPAPETLTYIIKLRRGIKFHDPDTLSSDIRGKVAIKDVKSKFPGLGGRELTAEDVKYSFERQKNPNSPRRALYYRSSQYETIEKVEVIDSYTLRVTTKKPTAPFLHFLTDTNAFIIPREVVDEGRDTLDFARSEPQSRMIGTGPFVWGEMKSLQEFNCYRNPAWFGWGQTDLGRPYVDGYRSLFVVDDASVEALFRDKKIDAAGFGSNPNWVFDIKNDMPELEFLRQQISGWVNSRFKVADNVTGEPCPTDVSPWSDIRLRRAVHLGANRQDVVDVIWKGEARMVGPVGAAIPRWALSEDELKQIPGYRQGPEREQDLALAKQLYEEAGRPRLEFVFADQPSYIPNFAPTFLENLRRVLGADVKDATIRAYPQIAEGLLRGCDFMQASWGFDNGWIDLDDWVYPYFHTGGPKNSFGVRDPFLDDLLDAQRAEFDEDRRLETGLRIQRYLLGMDPDVPGKVMEPPGKAAFSRLDYGSLYGASVSWPYFKNRTTWPWFGNNYWIADTWFDKNDPSYQGRA